MATRAEHAQGIRESDARELWNVVKVIRRRRIIFPGVSRAAVCRALLIEADRCIYPPKESDAR